MKNSNFLLLDIRCDVPRTPHRRTQDREIASGGSRTAPRPMNSLNSSIVGIGKIRIIFYKQTITLSNDVKEHVNFIYKNYLFQK